MMSALMPVPLPPGVVADEVTLANGEKATVYRAPFEVEGPVRFVDAKGVQLLVFRYANFVFVWLAGRRTVDISHGTLTGQNLVMFRNVPIEGAWSEMLLADFGTRWARDRLSLGRSGGLTERFPVA